MILEICLRMYTIIKYKTLPLGLDHCRINDLYTSFVGSHDGASQHIISYCDYLNVHNYMKSGTVQGKTFERENFTVRENDHYWENLHDSMLVYLYCQLTLP